MMPPWVGVEAVWETTTNSSSEGVNILAKLRLWEAKKKQKNSVVYQYMYNVHHVSDQNTAMATL